MVVRNMSSETSVLSVPGISRRTRAWLTFKTHYRPHKRPTATFQYFIPLPFKRLLSIMASPENNEIEFRMRSSAWLLEERYFGFMNRKQANHSELMKHRACVASHGIHRWTALYKSLLVILALDRDEAPDYTRSQGLIATRWVKL